MINTTSLIIKKTTLLINKQKLSLARKTGKQNNMNTIKWNIHAIKG